MSDPRRGDLSNPFGVHTVFIPKKKKKRHEPRMSGRDVLLEGTPFERRKTRQATSEDWRREREALAVKGGTAGSIDLPEHKLPGGERTLSARAVEAWEKSQRGEEFEEPSLTREEAFAAAKKRREEAREEEPKKKRRKKL